MATKEVRNYGIIVFIYIKNIFENGWWEDAYSSFYPTGIQATKTISDHDTMPPPPQKKKYSPACGLPICEKLNEKSTKNILLFIFSCIFISPSITGKRSMRFTSLLRNGGIPLSVFPNGTISKLVGLFFTLLL